MKTCNHCSGQLEKHDGMLHCLECGCYFVGKDGQLAPDHSACRLALQMQIPVAGATWANDEVGPEEEATEPLPASVIESPVPPTVPTVPVEPSAAPESPPNVTPIPLEVSKGGKPSPDGEEIAPEDSPSPERITRKKAN
jgi:hypothetical protein